MKILTARNLWKNSVNDPVSKCMVSISDEVLLIDQEIMINIKLPKFAVYHIEVLIWEKPAGIWLKLQNTLETNSPTRCKVNIESRKN